MAERWRQVTRLLTRPREAGPLNFFAGDPRLLLIPKSTLGDQNGNTISELSQNRYGLPNPPDSILANVDRTQSEPIKRETITHSVTESYQQDQWGPLRIALDGIQNHLPADAKATWFGVQFKSDGVWYDYSYLSDYPDQKIEAVRFADDGRGFVPQELGVMSTSKTEDRRAAGQFGEGLKMVSAAALRLGMQMLIESRNWQAAPSFEAVRLTDRTARRLLFDVNYFADQVPGSRTTFFKPTKNFLAVIRELDQHALPIRGNGYKPLATKESVDIVDTRGNVYIKGLQYARGLFHPFYSYNFVDLDDRAIKRDRESIDHSEAEQVFKEMRRALPFLHDEEAIKAFCEAGLKGYGRDEFRLLNGLHLPWQLYENAVYEIAGTDKVFLTEDSIFDRALTSRKEWYLRTHGYKALTVHGPFRSFLEGPIGIPTAKDWALDDQLDKDRERELEYLSPDQLSFQERSVLELQTTVDDFLGTSKELKRKPTHVYQVKDRKSGYEMLFLDQERRRGFVAINKKLLNNPQRFLSVFLQERANQISGSAESSRQANDFIKNRLAKLLLDLKKKGVLN